MVVTTTNKSRVKTSSGWQRFKQIQVYTSSGWQTVKASYVWKIVNNIGKWVQWWPTSGPISLTDPYINKSSSSTTRLSGVVRIGTYSNGTYTAQKLYGHNGTWDLNGTTITSYKYYWRRALTEVAEDMVSFKNGTYSTSAGTEITLNSIYYDKRYMDFEIDALTADPDVLGQAFSSDTDGFIYVIKNKPQVIGTPSFDKSSYNVGEIITYTGDWRFELGYIPESFRSNVQWYKTTGTIMDPSSPDAVLITSGSDGYYISTNIVENSLQYTVVSSMSGIEDGYNYFIVDTQYNSGSDYDLGETNGVSAIVSTLGVTGKPNPPGVAANAFSYGADYIRFYFTPSVVDLTHPKPTSYQWIVKSTSSTPSASTVGTTITANNPDNQTYYVDYTINPNSTQTNYYFFCKALTTSTSYSNYAGPQLGNLQGGLVPIFGEFTSFSTSEMRGTITNYDPTYTWTITSTQGSYSEISIVGSVLTFKVTGLIPGQSTTITAKTSKAGYSDAQASKVGYALYNGYYPTFSTNFGTNTGFTGAISNYNSNWTWDATVTGETKGSTGGITFSPPSGSSYGFTVYGLKYGESATVNVTTKRIGYMDATDSTTGTALDPVYTVPNLVGTLASSVAGEYNLIETTTTKTTDMSLTNKVASQSPVAGTTKHYSDLPIDITVSKYEYDSQIWYKYYSVCKFNGYYSLEPTESMYGTYFSDGSNLPTWPDGSSGLSVYTVTSVGDMTYTRYAWGKTRSEAASKVLNSSCIVGYTVPNFVGQYAPADTADYVIAYTTTTRTSDMALTNKIASQSPVGGTVVNAANKPITITVSLYNYDMGTTWYKGYSSCLFSGYYSSAPTIIATGTYFADGSNLPTWPDGSAGKNDYSSTSVGDMTVYKYAWRTSSAAALSAVINSSCTVAPFFPPYFVPPYFATPPFFPPFFPPYFVPPYFAAPPFFPPFFPPYFVPPYFAAPPFFPPYFVPPTFEAPPFFPPFFPPYFVPPYFAAPPFFPPFFPPYFVPPYFAAPPFFPPFFPPYFVPPTFKAPPFFPPYFVPPSFCVDEFTLISTINGYVMAKDIKIGDVLFKADIINNKVVMSTAKVKNIQISDHESMLEFNNNGVRFTEGEDVILINNGYESVKASTIKIGDKILSNSHGNLCELLVENISITTAPSKGYNFAPIGIIFTQSIAVDHTK
jgi:hypothetical protein